MRREVDLPSISTRTRHTEKLCLKGAEAQFLALFHLYLFVSSHWVRVSHLFTIYRNGKETHPRKIRKLPMIERNCYRNLQPALFLELRPVHRPSFFRFSRGERRRRGYAPNAGRTMRRAVPRTRIGGGCASSATRAPRDMAGRPSSCAAAAPIARATLCGARSAAVAARPAGAPVTGCR